jgi:hypothetical protein
MGEGRPKQSHGCAWPDQRQRWAKSRMTRPILPVLWEPWMVWAYGAGFDCRTEEHLREVLESQNEHATKQLARAAGGLTT